jgi:hypothetical protein
VLLAALLSGVLSATLVRVWDIVRERNRVMRQVLASLLLVKSELANNHSTLNNRAISQDKTGTVSAGAYHAVRVTLAPEVSEELLQEIEAVYSRYTPALRSAVEADDRASTELVTFVRDNTDALITSIDARIASQRLALKQRWRFSVTPSRSAPSPEMSRR